MKPIKQLHTSSSKKGMGDYYGQGMKNPVGKIRDMSMSKPKAPSKIGKPPKSLA